METTNLPVTRKKSIPVARLLDKMANDLELTVVAGFQGVGRPVFISDVNRPGLALGGYLEYFANDRVQILGNTEVHYMEQLSTSDLQHRLENMFSFEIPGFLLSRHLRPRNIFLDMCNRRGIPVLQSRRNTDEVISRIIVFLASEFCPETVVHGTVVDCYGVGCLIVGAPGIGKSETALELVERGHRLVADDVVALKRFRDDALYAETSPVIEHHMEIRGVGIIDVKSVYGVGRVRNSKRIGLIVELEEWKEDVQYDRTGLTDTYLTIMDVRIPILLIPVRPGRNIAIIIEVAALNHRLKELGVHPALELNQRLLRFMNESDA
ncbi:MAG: HPr(Ser) kinase/phosphatase [Candidatus Hydrogenedentes bacterium]|nr:HPr(Ser) kinase/phosphatase [Candidatus Hydrogenedentota bacterium]